MIEARPGIASGDGQTRRVHQRANFYSKGVSG